MRPISKKTFALILWFGSGGCTGIEPSEGESEPGPTIESQCGAGQELCGNTCVSTALDPFNCGACGTTCTTEQTCSSGVCTCGPGSTPCGAGCADFSSDGFNCGACGNACPSGSVCSLGQCSSSCAAGLRQCGASCVNTNTSSSHCGDCDQLCAPGEACSSGICSCTPGQTECLGSCTDTMIDPSNCGACGIACTNGASCSSGQCVGGGTGGAGSGGMSSGGMSSGGMSSGGMSSGGMSSGGMSSGGMSSGGAPSGGASSGGASSGGTSSGGNSSMMCTNIRPTGTDWDEATCAQWASETSECGEDWMVESGYCNESCGRCDSGGSGGSSSGGSNNGSGGSTSSCNQADLQVCSNGIGTHCGYTYEYWKDQGTGCQTNTADGFSVEWNNINNLLGRKGIRPGLASHVVTYSANYNPNGNSYLCVYGWSQGPLAEYYIVDSWGNWRPPGGTPLGTIQSDGGTYDIYRTLRENQPSIEGTATFPQYWSVRQSKRTNGTVTVANHFNAWAAQGMNMGSIYEVSMTVEGYQSSGSADVTLSIQ